MVWLWGAWGEVRTGQAWLDAYLFADGAEMAELLGHVYMYRVYLTAGVARVNTPRVPIAPSPLPRGEQCLWHGAWPQRTPP